MNLRKILALAAVPALALTMAGCSSANSGAKKTEENSTKVQIFASTNVWGAIASAVGGDLVDVSVGVSKPEQDPHDYQASAQDKLKISKAKLILVNGGGYDDWATKLAKSADNKPKIIDAVAASGLKPAEADHDHDKDKDKDKDKDHASQAPGHEGHDHGEFNEHVFYSLDTAIKVAALVNKELAQVDPANKTKFAENFTTFEAAAKAIKAKSAAFASTHKGVQVLATEPVVGYLLADMGIVSITPEEFIEQSETEAGPSAKVVDATVKLITDKQAKALILNAQTEDAVSTKLVQAAAGVQTPIVKVNESFPVGIKDYLKWIEQTQANIAKALN